MKFIIPFDKDIYLKQTKLQFDYVWKAGLEKSQKGLVVGLILIVVGGFFAINKSLFGFVIVIIGSIYTYKFYEYFASYKANKKRFFSEAESYIIEETKKGHESLWEFEDNFFRYEVEKFQTRTHWSYFKNFKIIEDNIFINTSHQNISFILAKDELNDENFDKIISFLETKLKKTGD